MAKRLIRWIAERVLERELNTLHRYRVRIGEYDRWLANMPDVVRLLENLRGQCEYSGRPGTVNISHLRDEMRRMRAEPGAYGLARLHETIKAMRGQQSKMAGTGQTHTFIVKDEVLGRIEDLQQSCAKRDHWPRVAEGVREVLPLSEFSVELRFHSCRQAQAFIGAAIAAMEGKHATE